MFGCKKTTVNKKEAVSDANNKQENNAETKTTESKTQETKNQEVNNEQSEEKEELVFKKPVNGEIIREFAQNSLVYSDTLKE